MGLHYDYIMRVCFWSGVSGGCPHIRRGAKVYLKAMYRGEVLTRSVLRKYGGW